MNELGNLIDIDKIFTSKGMLRTRNLSLSIQAKKLLRGHVTLSKFALKWTEQIIHFHVAREALCNHSLIDFS